MLTSISTLVAKAAHRRALKDMMKLDDRLLRDVGLTRTELAFMITGRDRTGAGRDA